MNTSRGWTLRLHQTNGKHGCNTSSYMYMFSFWDSSSPGVRFSFNDHGTRKVAGRCDRSSRSSCVKKDIFLPASRALSHSKTHEQAKTRKRFLSLSTWCRGRLREPQGGCSPSTKHFLPKGQGHLRVFANTLTINVRLSQVTSLEVLRIRILWQQ